MDQGSCRRWQFGDVIVTQLVELELAVSPRFLLTSSNASAIGELDWLSPHYVNAEGRLLSSIHAYIIDDGRNRVIVDTCIGKDKRRAQDVWSRLDGPFLENLARAGYPAESITHVVCTHLHLDHVGWNTRFENGRWVPTFANARYIIAKQEWETWREIREGEQAAVIEDSIAPLFEAGRVELLDWNAPIVGSLGFAATPGHTFGHCSVVLEQPHHKMLITGDIMHHPVQIAFPDWGSPADADPLQATETRQRIVAAAQAESWTVFGSHFSRRPCGCIAPSGGGRRFLAIEPESEVVLDCRPPKAMAS